MEEMLTVHCRVQSDCTVGLDKPVSVNLVKMVLLSNTEADSLGKLQLNMKTKSDQNYVNGIYKTPNYAFYFRCI